jgi:hypothetical protein
MTPQLPPARGRAAQARSAHTLLGRAWTYPAARSRLACTGSTGSGSRWSSSPEAGARPHSGGRGALVFPWVRLILAPWGEHGRKSHRCGPTSSTHPGGGNQPNDRQVSSTHSICEQNVTSTFFAWDGRCYAAFWSTRCSQDNADFGADKHLCPGHSTLYDHATRPMKLCVPLLTPPGLCCWYTPCPSRLYPSRTI